MMKDHLLPHILPHIIQWVIGGGVAIVFSAVARALPEPLPMGSRGYLFFYRFTQNLLANFDKGKLLK
jgi:hypothetical protein